MPDGVNEMKPRTKGSVYIQAVRTFSYPASTIPCLLGAMLALLINPSAAVWWLMPFIVVSLILLHSASNVISDYDDFRTGVDKKDTLGGSRVLVDGLISPKEMLRFGLTLFALSVVFGLPIIYTRGMVLLFIGILGILGGFFYTGRPVGYKYMALGDLFIFLIYGPAITTGTFYALTGTFNYTVLFSSVPLGLLITGILQANNLRDLIHDKNANVKTLATVFGEGFAKAEYLFLIIGAYVVVLLLIAFRILTPWSLLVLLSLPPAIKNMTAIKGIKVENTAKIAMLDAHTAQLTLMFGMLLSISVLISKFI